MFYDCYYFCQLCGIYVHGVPGVSGWISAWCPRVKLSDLSSLEILGDENFLIKFAEAPNGKTIQQSI